MRKKYLSPLVFAVLSYSVLAGCGTKGAPQDIPPKPEGVTQAQNEECHRQGVAAGVQAIQDMSDGAETFAALTGGLGAILAIGAAAGARDAAYTDAYQQCLKDDGKGKPAQAEAVNDEDEDLFPEHSSEAQ